MRAKISRTLPTALAVLALLGAAGCSGSDETGAGNDPCSGNPFTPTTPSTGQGTPAAGSSQDQLTALAQVDAYRNLIGLGPINFNAALDQSSQAHSDYCSTNSSWCPNWHDEVPGNPGFTGASFSDRTSAAGYGGSACFEVMAPGVGPVGAIEMWIDSVYHRTPFDSPGTLEAGFGGASQFTTMDFGCGGSSDPALVTNYPVHGQSGFPTMFLGNEGPEPPVPPSGWPSGSIISVIFPAGATVTVTAHQLYDASCTPVDHVAGGANITPDPGFQTGFLGSSMVMYGNAPLQSGQTYTVNVEYTLNGAPGNRTFQFTTQ